MNLRIDLLSAISPSFLSHLGWGGFPLSPARLSPFARQLQGRKYRFLATAALTSLGLLLAANLNIAPVRGQLIKLPEGVKAPTIGITEAGNLDVGKVELDGQILFSVAAPTVTNLGDASAISPIERRVKTINFHLARIVTDGFDPNSLAITPATLNNQTVLVASDKDWGPRYILTVTPYDVELDEPGTTDEIAQKWSKTIAQALLQAGEQRQFAYQKRQIPFAFAILAAMFAGSLGIDKLQKYRANLRQRLERKREALKGSDLAGRGPDISPASLAGGISSQTPPSLRHHRHLPHFPHLSIEQQIGINLTFRSILFACHLGIWFGGAALIFQRFPQTRVLGNWLLRVPLAYTGIFLGMLLLKSALDSLCHLFLQRAADRIRERNADVERLYPRAMTIFAVLQEFNGYVACILGFLLFFYAINALYIALIILGGIAFLTQSVIQDFVKTYFILAEDFYALGDWVEINGLNGEVEKVSLRNSQIRAICGDLHSINHGIVDRVTNYSHRYSGIDLWVDVAYSTDLDFALSVMEQVAREMQQDAEWGKYLTSSSVKGVEEFGDSGISLRIILMSQTGEQWGVAREYRRRLKPAFDRAGITIPFPQRSIWFESGFKTQESQPKGQ